MKKQFQLNFGYTREKYEAYRKLSAEQKLEWLEKMSRFLYYFMPKESKLRWEKLRQGKT